MKKKLAEIAAEEFEIPKEVALDMPRITIVGDRDITIENSRGIISYDDKQIKVNTKTAVITVKGDGLQISCITNDGVCISGVADSVEFLR
ncbi:MAG: sporulation protein YqfC [Bacillota bacterium]|nr:sporulation protein YqfC [Bacillota bacterium]